MRVVIAILAMILAGCQSVHAPLMDQELIIEHSYRTYEESAAICEVLMGADYVGATACSFWNKKTCRIYYKRGDEEQRQHELRHCSEGHFHL